MYAADISMNTSAMNSQTGMWILAIFLLGLASMAWLTVREASLYETRSAIRNLRRRRKTAVPQHERITALSRANLFIRSLLRGSDILEPFQEVLGDRQAIDTLRLRREIDKLVGKDVYHGQKEQLKPPSRPTSD